LEAVTTAEARRILADAFSIWKPYLQVLRPLLSASALDSPQLSAAAQYARSRNLKLLGLMNDLTTDLERVAASKAERLRLVQTVGIILALLNFAFILLKFIRKLEAADRRTEAARQETEEILATVREGLFLLDADFRIGSQYSQSLASILRLEIRPGVDFFGLLEDMVSAETFAAARDYVELLFADRGKEGLVGSLNPLSEVEVKSEVAGKQTTRYLSFQFNRVISGTRTSHLLVTVQDVTERVALAAQLKSAKHQGAIELDVLLKLLAAEPQTLRHFLANADTTLHHINERLKTAADGNDDRAQVVKHAFRMSHALKGEAAALGLEMLEDLIHAFERELVAMRERSGGTGEDMVRLMVRLEDLFERVAQVRKIAQRIQRSAPRGIPTKETDTAAETFMQNVKALASRIAADQQKEVRVCAALDALADLPEPVSDELRDITVQLLRNAISHGIEPPDERATAAKPATGHIYVACSESEDGTYEFVLRDDGRGLVPDRIRAALARSQYPQERLAALGDRDVLLKIFEPGFSTSETTDRDAGHGMGMAVIREKIERLGGHLRVTTRPYHYTEFSIRFAPSKSNGEKTAEHAA